MIVMPVGTSPFCSSAGPATGRGATTVSLEWRRRKARRAMKPALTQTLLEKRLHSGCKFSDIIHSATWVLNMLTGYKSNFYSVSWKKSWFFSSVTQISLSFSLLWKGKVLLK